MRFTPSRCNMIGKTRSLSILPRRKSFPAVRKSFRCVLLQGIKKGLTVLEKAEILSYRSFAASTVPPENHHRNNVTEAKIRGRPEFWRTTAAAPAASAETAAPASEWPPALPASPTDFQCRSARRRQTPDPDCSLAFESNRSGTRNCAGSRFAAPSIKRIGSPGRSRTPQISSSSFASARCIASDSHTAVTPPPPNGSLQDSRAVPPSPPEAEGGCTSRFPPDSGSSHVRSKRPFSKSFRTPSFREGHARN